MGAWACLLTFLHDDKDTLGGWSVKERIRSVVSTEFSLSNLLYTPYSGGGTVSCRRKPKLPRQMEFSLSLAWETDSQLIRLNKYCESVFLEPCLSGRAGL